jgi:hypothetical protein
MASAKFGKEKSHFAKIKLNFCIEIEDRLNKKEVTLGKVRSER